MKDNLYLLNNGRKDGSSKSKDKMIQNIKQTYIFHSLLFLTIILSSCSGAREITSFENLGKSNCYNQADYHYTFDEIPKPLERQSVDLSLSKNFSFESLT